MKDSEIHNGLSDEHERKFLSYELVSILELESTCKKNTTLYYGTPPWEWAIRDCKNIIEYNQERLKILELRKGLDAVIKNHGWEEYDVSDYVIKEGDKYCKPFIGTEEEYEELIKIIENE